MKWTKGIVVAIALISAMLSFPKTSEAGILDFLFGKVQEVAGEVAVTRGPADENPYNENAQNEFEKTFYETIEYMSKAYQFYKLRKTLPKFNNSTEAVYLRTEKPWFSPEQYVLTINKSSTKYEGEIKNNMPDGKGILVSITEYMTSMYVGSFKEGRQDGYGLEAVLMPGERKFRVVYEGFFKEGSRYGKGNKYTSGLYSGIWKDGKMNGEFVIYNKNFILVFEGLCEYDNMVSGKEYDGDTGELKYEGDFKDGQYHGQGTLYNPDGSIAYSGKWNHGDYAN